MRRIALLALLVIACHGCATAPPTATPSTAAETTATPAVQDRPIGTLAGQRFAVTTAAGVGVVPLYVSRDWEKPQPGVTRAVILVHGLLGRDVFVKTADELPTAADAGRSTVMIAPEFLTDLDVKSHRLPDEVLHWRMTAPGGGGYATGPALISSFEVLDAILARLAERTRFPDLTRVVLAGHSGGGQMVQRYAVVGHGDAVLTAAGVPVRYVVANPSSYLYFSAERPKPDGGFGPADEGRCPAVNRWRYGLIDAPAYVGGKSADDLERTYVARDVVYLLGTADNDPAHYELDRTCGGEAQGPHRHARGLAYMRYMQGRHPSGLNHHLWEVPGVGHAGKAMFVSACGLAALFDRPGCRQP